MSFSASPTEDPQVTADRLHMEGMIAFHNGQAEASIHLVTRAIELNPNEVNYLNNLGIVLQSLGRIGDAVNCFRRALALQPDMAEAMSNLGNALDLRGSYVEAEAQCRAALRLKPSFADAWNNLGNTLAHQGRVVEAETCYREAVRLHPPFLEAHRNLGHILQEQGQFADARRQYEEVLRLNPGDVMALYSLTLSKHYTNADHAELARIERLLETPQRSPQERSYLDFAAGKICDDCGLYDKAFRHFQRANDLVKPGFNQAAHANRIQQLMTVAAQPYPPTPAPPAAALTPIFIVGMPRSGTSLVEQMLSNHPEIHGCGEVKDIEDLVGWLPTVPGMTTPYPLCLNQIAPDLYRQMGEWYLLRRRTVAGPARFVTDKMPTNFLHLGLIARMLPNARIIHCRRDPLDVCLSCYFQNFALRPPYTYDMGDLGFFYRQHEQLMAHYARVLPVPILEVSYEELVHDPATHVRRLIDFCGLDWNERCLRFHENHRPVQTSSSWQVRQPLYQTSIGRWRNYAIHLDPLRRALAGQTATPPSPAGHWGNVIYVGPSDKPLAS